MIRTIVTAQKLFFVLLANIILVNSGFTLDAKRFETEVRACISQVYLSPLSSYYYPNLPNTKDDQKSPVFREFSEFCRCTVNKRKDELGLKYNDRLAWKFSDQKKTYYKLDQCALAHLSGNHLKMFFYTYLSGPITLYVLDSLYQRYHYTSQSLASRESVNSKILCFYSKFLERCSKIESLNLAFKCLEKELSDTELISEFEKDCPKIKRRDKAIDTDRSIDLL